VPFYEQLYRSQEGAAEPLRILHYGDSHTASDDWVNAIRVPMQKKFGAGGPGFIHPGRPFLGYRRYDAKSTATAGWKTIGLLNHSNGDGMYGLSGVAIETDKAGQAITVQAEGSLLAVSYLRQPGGGRLQLLVDGVESALIDTNDGAGPGYYQQAVPEGPHEFALRTMGDAPVRLTGWVVERKSGLTWETLGINGASIDLALDWHEGLFKADLSRRNPALIVLAYGTNEARRPDWDFTSYKAGAVQVIKKLRAAAPTASILVIGPPDQAVRIKRTWTPYGNVDGVAKALREAALATNCAFWNLRSAMGGKGSMKQWVYAGLAQGDYVHFTAPGYRLLGESLFELMMGQYEIFTTVRRQWIGTKENGSSDKTH
jgi:lysophospholipase L1-like esterase